MQMARSRQGRGKAEISVRKQNSFIEEIARKRGQQQGMHGDGSAASMPPARADALDPPRSLRLRRLSGMNLRTKDLFVSDAEREIKLTVRVSLAERSELRQRAFAAGLPVAVYLRASALAGAPIGHKPPAELDLPDPCKKLLHVCQASVSNCTQLHSHASAGGSPLDRVCPLLIQMQEQVRSIGLSVKGGAISESFAIEILASGLLSASDQINALAESLNEGQSATNQTWHAALTAFKNALEQVK